MTKSAFKKAFKELDSVEQAEVLLELAATHVSSMADEDAKDIEFIRKHRHEESKGRPLAEVVARIERRRKGRRDAV